MGNHAAANEIIAVDHRPLRAGRLSADAVLQTVDSFYARRRIDPEFAPISKHAIVGHKSGDCVRRTMAMPNFVLFYRSVGSWQRSVP